MKKKIIYLSYNGMNEALGASQVLSYLYPLSEDYEFHLISLEKSKDFRNKAKMASLENKLAANRIRWYPVEYKVDRLGKLTNFPRLLSKTRDVAKKYNIKYAHVRSYFPAMIANILKLKYLFDTRGFAFDERADVGSIKSNGKVFRLLKNFEGKLYGDALAVNKLSHEGKRTILENELFPGGDEIKSISVIPTCTDLERFQLSERQYEGPVKIGYVGTAVGWYDFDKTAATLREIGKQTDFRFIVFNGGQHDFIRSKLMQYSIPEDKFTIEAVDFVDMPSRLQEIEIALFYIHPYFSKRASAATKLGEFLASGIPVLTNAGVGDHEKLITESGAGQILDFEKLDSYDFKEIFQKLRNDEISKKSRAVAEQYFSLEKGVGEYRFLYSKIFI